MQLYDVHVIAEALDFQLRCEAIDDLQLAEALLLHYLKSVNYSSLALDYLKHFAKRAFSQFPKQLKIFYRWNALFLC